MSNENSQEYASFVASTISNITQTIKMSNEGQASSLLLLVDCSMTGFLISWRYKKKKGDLSGPALPSPIEKDLREMLEKN